MVTAINPTQPPTIHPKQKPLTKIKTVINSTKPGRDAKPSPLAYAITIVTADNTVVRANFFVSKVLA